MAEGSDVQGRQTDAAGEEFFATCPAGLESLLAGELESLGASRVRPLRGQVAFRGRLAVAYRACLWSRLASRVMLVLARVDASDADALYEGVMSVPWEDHVPLGATIAIDAHGTNDELRNTQFVALRAKDGVADRLMARRGARPMTSTDSPDVRIACRLSRTRATLAIDLAGEPLFRRDLPAGRVGLPLLRADYAAALLEAGAWWRHCRHDSPTLVALFPGAGSVLVEAAGEALDRAPGLTRATWGFAGWAGHDADAWESLVAEAEQRAEEGRTHLPTLVALDPRRGAERACRAALRAEGVGTDVTFVDPQGLAGALAGAQAPLAACDLTWLRADEVTRQACALSELSSCLAGLPASSSLATLSADAALDAALGQEPAEEGSVMLGRDWARLTLHELDGTVADRPQVRLKDGTTIPTLVGASDQFAARLEKVARLRGKWARREGIGCYRVYDSDLPDYAVTIDLFQPSELMPPQGRSTADRGPWLSVFEYAAPHEVDEGLARQRLLDVLAIAPRVLGVDPGSTFVRVRSHASGGSQYADGGRADLGGRDAHRGQDRRAGVPLPPGAHLVDEGGLTFEVNFSDRLDCGLFLDHRETRALVREMAKRTYGSKRFLNLFAYTGTATCYAADGGAKHTTSVDMSRPSLEWAQRNMERNGFTGPDHEYVQADVLSWVDDQRRTRNRWDLVFCDVPTFSNSSRMRGSWDVQRDHAELLIGISRLLTANGTCLFSCNFRRFKPDVEKLNRYGVEIEDITPETIPEDFKRNPKVHHCYRVWRTPRD